MGISGAVRATLGAVTMLAGLAVSVGASPAAQLYPWVYALPGGVLRQADAQPATPQVRPRYRLDPMFVRQVVAYATDQRPGTIIVDTGHKFLYLVLGDSQALRYGIGTARTGFEWSGVHRITAKREWPDWTPPPEMLARQPGIPTHMAGGLDNPLGARALYIGNTLYRIHGTNEPWTIGRDVSSGCIRMTNQDVIDLYGRVKIGASVIVL